MFGSIAARRLGTRSHSRRLLFRSRRQSQQQLRQPDFGFVPKKYIIAKVQLRWWPPSAATLFSDELSTAARICIVIDEKIRNLGTGAGRRSRKCAKSYTRQTLRSSKSGSGGKSRPRGLPSGPTAASSAREKRTRIVVKMTFSKGAALKDPSGLFNSSLEGNTRRAIDIHEGDKVDEAALKDSIRAAVALNLKGTSKPKRRSRS